LLCEDVTIGIFEVVFAVEDNTGIVVLIRLGKMLLGV